MAVIGIIGGSGLDDPGIFSNPRDEKVDTPYGPPSSPLKRGIIGETEVILLARHGREQTTAVGSLREEIHRGDLVVIDQFIDFTKQRKMTYFESFEPRNPIHRAMADPYDQRLRTILIEECKRRNYPFHEKGTVITIEGPRFSTRAESCMFRTWGADIINMSIATETVLANEIGVPYAVIAMSTDYDSWRIDEEPVTWEAISRVSAEKAERVTGLLVGIISHI